MDLRLYTLQEGLKYPMGQAVAVIAVLKNVKKWPINTDPISELERALVLTDPAGVKHVPLVSETKAADMPPTYKWGGFDTAPAEVLEQGARRSVTIDDVTVLFPVMRALSGWYTLQARMPASRYGWTVHTKTGRMGVLDEKAWHGVIDSNELRIFVAPSRGGRLRVRVEDLGSPEARFKDDVEVRIFERSGTDRKSVV